jgi:hypothetical protein
MHFHLPKPLHGWREFAGEVGIIVIGVLIALGAEQVLDNVRWHQKVDAAQRSIDFELNDELDYSEEAVALGRCTGPFVDALESAILRHDAAAIGKLHDTRPPFEPRPWRSTAWESSMSTGVADHFSQDQLDEYAFMFSSLQDIRRTQDAIINDFAEAATGRVGGPADATATQLQLAAAERLRTQLNLESVIANTMIGTAAGRTIAKWKPIERHRFERLTPAAGQRKAALCIGTVREVGTGAKDAS